MRDEEEANAENAEEIEEVEEESDEDEKLLFGDVEASEEDGVIPSVEESAEASTLRDDEYYKALSEEIAELRKELEEQKRVMELDKREAEAREEELRKENTKLAEELEENLNSVDIY